MLLKGDVDGILGFDSTMYFNLVRQGIKPEDIKFLYYSDAGMDIYGNAILASKKILTEQPAVVKGSSRRRPEAGRMPSRIRKPPSPR
jgi:NMT1/THI5 like.